MTKRLAPEIKALRAINRALSSLDATQVRRCLEWRIAHDTGKSWFYLPLLTHHVQAGA